MGTAHNSEGSQFRRFSIPKVLKSEGSQVRRVSSPKINMTWSGRELTTYRMRGRHASHPDAVFVVCIWLIWNQFSHGSLCNYSNAWQICTCMSQPFINWARWFICIKILNKHKSIFRKVAEVMKISGTDTDQKEGALLEFYTSAIWWGREQGFTVQQISALFTVIYTVLDNLKGKQKRWNYSINDC